MGKFTLVTGGARSGKSSFAEQLANNYGSDVLYIATAIPFDEEMRLRVKKHREQRPANWETFEGYKDFDIRLNSKANNKSAVMLDCATIMVSNIMFEENLDWDNIEAITIETVEQKVKKQIEKLLGVIRDLSVPFIIVTNELGMGIVPENALARIFRDVAGRANQMLAKEADEVYLCVSGIPVKIK